MWDNGRINRTTLEGRSMTDDRPIPATPEGRRVRAQVDTIRGGHAVRRNATNRDLNRRLADVIARAQAAENAARFGPPPTARHAADLAGTDPADQATIREAADARLTGTWDREATPNTRTPVNLAAMGAGLPAPTPDGHLTDAQATRRAVTGLVLIVVALAAFIAMAAVAKAAPMGAPTVATDAGQVAATVAQGPREMTGARYWRRTPDRAVIVRPYDFAHLGFFPSDLEAYNLRTGREVHGYAFERTNLDIISSTRAPILVLAWRDR